MARKKQGVVLKEHQKEEEEQCKKRCEQMLQTKQKHDALCKRLQKGKDTLSKIHLITSPNELNEAMISIDRKNISKPKKRQEKLTLLKTQIKIRKKVLNQKVDITFLNVINSILYVRLLKISQFYLLVGSRIKHKFEIPESFKETWFYGSVISYNDSSKLHEITYDDEKENCSLDLTQDLIMGDLVII